MNVARFGEKVDLPAEYDFFWHEYQSIVDGRELSEYDQKYLERRIHFWLPDEGNITVGNKERLIFSRKFQGLPVIHDRYTFFFQRDDASGEPTILASEEKETIISLQPEIETILYAEEIRRYRKISPGRVPINYYAWLNAEGEGNPHLVGILLALFDDYAQMQPKKERDYKICGNEMASLPSSYPTEHEIAQLYTAIGRIRFEAVAQEVMRLEKVLGDARNIDDRAVIELEQSAEEQCRKLRLGLIENLEKKPL